VYYYIPIFKTLAQILQDGSIVDEIRYSSKRIGQDEFLHDFCDGSMFKTHPLFSEYPISLQIVAYYDELEVCDPLGTHTKKNINWELCFLRWLTSDHTTGPS